MTSLTGACASDCLPTQSVPPEQTADEVLSYRANGFKAVQIRAGGAVTVEARPSGCSGRLGSTPSGKRLALARSLPGVEAHAAANSACG